MTAIADCAILGAHRFFVKASGDLKIEDASKLSIETVVLTDDCGLTPSSDRNDIMNAIRESLGNPVIEITIKHLMTQEQLMQI